MSAAWPRAMREAATAGSAQPDPTGPPAQAMQQGAGTAKAAGPTEALIALAGGAIAAGARPLIELAHRLRGLW